MAAIAPEPTNATYGPEESIEKTAQPVYIAGYRISTDNVKWFLAANVTFVLVIVLITIVVMPLGIPFLAVKRSDGLLTYMGFFFTYMFGYFAFFILVAATLGAGSYAVQQRYFPA